MDLGHGWLSFDRPLEVQKLLLTLTQVYQYSQYVTLPNLVRLTPWQTRPQSCSSR